MSYLLLYKRIDDAKKFREESAAVEKNDEAMDTKVEESK